MSDKGEPRKTETLVAFQKMKASLSSGAFELRDVHNPPRHKIVKSLDS